jgi:hypothetical protein
MRLYLYYLDRYAIYVSICTIVAAGGQLEDIWLSDRCTE